MNASHFKWLNAELVLLLLHTISVKRIGFGGGKKINIQFKKDNENVIMSGIYEIFGGILSFIVNGIELWLLGCWIQFGIGPTKKRRKNNKIKNDRRTPFWMKWAHGFNVLLIKSDLILTVSSVNFQVQQPIYDLFLWAIVIFSFQISHSFLGDCLIGHSLNLDYDLC